MSEEFLERVSASGLILKVNSRRGNFLAFKNGSPLSVFRLGGNSQIHPLDQVIFLGAFFSFTASEVDKVNFFEVKHGFILIPLPSKSVSDVRHVRVPSRLGQVDLIPAYICSFKNYWPGPLPRIGGGSRYFFADSAIDRESIVRLKRKFPSARLIVFRPDEYKSRKHDRSDFYPSEDERALDYLSDADLGILSKNPLFAARVCLRKKDWPHMYLLPDYGKLNQEILSGILSFLDTMLTKSSSSSQNIACDLASEGQEIFYLYGFYDALARVFTRDINAVKQWKKDYHSEYRNLLGKIVHAIENQYQFLIEEKDLKRASFFKDAIRTLKGIEFLGYDQ